MRKCQKRPTKWRKRPIIRTKETYEWLVVCLWYVCMQKCQKSPIHMAKETYNMAKETYNMAKETYIMTKGTSVGRHLLRVCLGHKEGDIATHVHTHKPHTCIRTYVHTHIHAYAHTCIRIYVHTHIRAYAHTYRHIPGAQGRWHSRPLQAFSKVSALVYLLCIGTIESTFQNAFLSGAAATAVA